MNLYFLVEGKRTEMKVYPAWLSHLIPKLRRVEDPSDLNDSGYYIFSGEGYPSLLDVHLPNAIADYRDCGKFNRLVVCLDVDDSSVTERTEEVTNRVKAHRFPIEQLRIIPQECCIETWFLGHRRAVSPAPHSSELSSYLRYFNVRRDDPETMGKPNDFNARSVFHSRYFQLVAQDKQFRYTKHRPQHVVDEAFLNELVSRRRETEHLPTFGAFLDLCNEISLNCP